MTPFDDVLETQGDSIFSMELGALLQQGSQMI